MRYDYLIEPDWNPSILNRSDCDPALWNHGDATRLLRLHREHAARVSQHVPNVPPIGPLLFSRTADARTLHAALDHLQRHGGEAPGPNGLVLQDLEKGEGWSLCRALAKALKEKTYRPGPHQTVQIPKGGGRFRKLEIQNIEDRIVGKALSLILEPVVDPTFYQFSMGFRPQRGPHDALTTALLIARTEKRMVWVSDDVANAFDAVPFNRLMLACAKHFPEDVLELIRLCIGRGSKRGIRQGSPASPLFWNIFADRFIDRAFLSAGRLIRYADDLLLLYSTVEEAEIAYRTLRETCRNAGTPLKGGTGNGIFDLEADQSATWLGYRLHRRDDGLGVHIADRGWRRLQQNLFVAHYKPASPIRAIEIVKGWLAYFGPCYAFEDRRDVLGRLRAEAVKQGFDELPSRRSLDALWQRAYIRWRRNYERRAQELSQAPVVAG